MQATAAAPSRRGGLAASRFANSGDDDSTENSTDLPRVEGEDDDPYSVAVASVRTNP